MKIEFYSWFPRLQFILDISALQWFDMIYKTITALVAGIGVFIAFNGLQTWKKQLKGKSDYELAQRLMLLTIKYRQAMTELRNPMVWHSENFIPPQEQKQGMTDAQINDYIRSRNYEERFKQVEKIKPALIEAIFETEVLWGENIKNSYEDLFKLEYEVTTAISEYINNKDRRADHTDLSDKKIEQAKHNLALRDDTLDENDIYVKEFEILFNKIKKQVEPYLKLKY